MRTVSTMVFLCILYLYVVAAGGGGVRVGGWKPIEDLKEPHVVEIGEFAVAEYDRRSKAGLRFERVVSGETQVVSGTNFRLVVAASQAPGPTKNYQAVVWEKPWLKSMNLTSFRAATG